MITLRLSVPVLGSPEPSLVGWAFLATGARSPRRLLEPGALDDLQSRCLSPEIGCYYYPGAPSI